MVIHMIEEPGGETQPVLMRSLSAHLMAMDRKVEESHNIIEETRKPGQCLNIKSEWAGSKIPGLQVHLPKGVSGKEPGKASDQAEPRSEQERDPGNWKGKSCRGRRRQEKEATGPIGQRQPD